MLLLPGNIQFNNKYELWKRYTDYKINSGEMQSDYILQQSAINLSDSTFKISGFYNKSTNPLTGFVQTSYGITSFQRYRHNYSLYFGEFYRGKHLDLGNITGINRKYKFDPNFAGDLSESDHWLYGRVEQAYGRLHTKGFNLFIGRTARNWGPINATSLILSDYSYSYDHLLFSYESAHHFKFSMIYAPMGESNGRTFDNPDSTIYNVSRYLVGHRLDIRFSQRFQIALTEMATYGGPGRQFELAFMNPMTFYYPLQRNDRKEMDGFWCVDLFYKPSKQMTLYGQFLLDDIVVNNDPGINDRARFDDRFGLMISFRTGDLLLKGINTDLTYHRIWNRTYQSKYSWQNYQYRGLGLGYPCAGCEELKIKVGYWFWSPFYLETEVIIGRYGAVNLTDLFPMKKEPFPVPPAENNVIFNLNLEYFVSTTLYAKLGIRYMQNAQHYSERLNPQNGIVASLNVSWRFNYGFGEFLW